ACKMPSSLHAQPDPCRQKFACKTARYEHAYGRSSRQARCQKGTNCPGCLSPTPCTTLIIANTIVQTMMYAKLRRRPTRERPNPDGSNHRSSFDRAARSINWIMTFNIGTGKSLS